jgi:hypothetical protein
MAIDEEPVLQVSNLKQLLRRASSFACAPSVEQIG